MGEKLSQMEEVYNHDFRVAFSYLNQYGPGTHGPSQTRFHGESLLHLTYQPASMTNTLTLPFQSLLGHNWVFEIVVL